MRNSALTVEEINAGGPFPPVPYELYANLYEADDGTQWLIYRNAPSETAKLAGIEGTEEEWVTHDRLMAAEADQFDLKLVGVYKIDAGYVFKPTNAQPNPEASGDILDVILGIPQYVYAEQVNK